MIGTLTARSQNSKPHIQTAVCRLVLEVLRKQEQADRRAPSIEDTNLGSQGFWQWFLQVHCCILCFFKLGWNVTAASQRQCRNSLNMEDQELKH